MGKFLKLLMGTFGAASLLTLTACSAVPDFAEDELESLLSASDIKIKLIRVEGSVGSVVSEFESGSEIDVGHLEGFNLDVEFNEGLEYDKVVFKLGQYGKQTERIAPFSACGNPQSNRQEYNNCRTSFNMVGGSEIISIQAFKGDKAVTPAHRMILNLNESPSVDETTNPEAPTEPDEPTEPDNSVKSYLIDVGATANSIGSDGSMWSKDIGFVGGEVFNRGSVAIANSNDDLVYQTERYDLTGYKLSIANGTYKVTLHFAETYSGISSAGQRVFDVKAEDLLLLSQLDIFKEAGGRNKALTKSFVVRVQDEELTLSFIKRTQSTVVQGIEVAVSTLTPTEPVVPVEPEEPSEPSEPTPPSEGENTWMMNNFSGARVYTGVFSERTTVETPAIVKNATACCGKYAFAPRDSDSPDDRRVAFSNVTITNLSSSDSYGGAIGTSRGDSGMKIYISNVTVEPNWPTWEDYNNTNYDGIVTDGSTEFYAEDLSIKNWNADAAIDQKADISQLVRVTTQGKGHRTLRYWGEGPHYIVDSNINNTGAVGEGSLIWMYDCSSTKIYVYNSKFNGSSTIANNKISCDNGNNPQIIYLSVDPRTTGEMHPMFSN